MRLALATVGTTGDVRPFVVLGRALAAAGHEVTAITWPVHVAAFEVAGIAAVAAGPHDDPARIASVAEAAARRDAMGQVAVLRDFHLEDGAAHLRRLVELLPAWNGVVFHGIHALAHAAALDAGVPFATAVFDPVLLPTRSAPPPGMPSLGPANRLLWAVLDRALARTGRPLDDVLREVGSGRRGLPLFRARSARLHLVACSPSLIQVAPDLPPTTRVTGAWLDSGEPDPLPPELEAFLAAGDAPVVITFGSMGGAFRAGLDTAVAALVAAGRRVVVQGRVRVTGSAVLELGEVDHRALFPRAAVVVHHGGAGTTHAAVAAGRPSVVVPHVGDQRYWAARLEALGVAPRSVDLGGPSGGEDLARAALAVAADETCAGRATALAARLAAEDGVSEAVALIEERLRPSSA